MRSTACRRVALALGLTLLLAACVAAPDSSSRPGPEDDAGSAGLSRDSSGRKARAVTLRVRKKIFAFPSRGASLMVKADPEELEALLGDPRFKPAPYLARGGWVSMDMAKAPIDWDEVRELIVTSYCLIAPKTLGRQVSL